jgi:hypothetical protein
MMTDREYRLMLITSVWINLAGSEPTKLIEYLREQDNDRAIDAVLFALGFDPEKTHNPLPDMTLMEELDGLA